MPYVTCSACALTSFSAAYRWQPDFCARCGAELPRPRTAAARSQNAAWVSPAASRDERTPGTAGVHTTQSH